MLTVLILVPALQLLQRWQHFEGLLSCAEVFEAESTRPSKTNRSVFRSSSGFVTALLE